MSEAKEQLLKFDSIIKLLLKHQCIMLLRKFKCLYKLSENDYKKEYNNICKQIDVLVIVLTIENYIKISKKISHVPLQNRCSARTFNYNNIITQKGDKIIYGSRCTRQKVSNTKYCKQHNINCPHGDYNDNVSSYIKEHYIKEYKLYIKKEKIKSSINFT